MRKLLLALAGVAFLASCDNADPTDKDDMGCTVENYKSTNLKACSQLHITEAEALVAKGRCEDTAALGGTWDSNPCPAENRVAGGYCKVEASEYNLSGSDAKVYFYTTATSQPDVAAATLACNNLGGGAQWVAE